mgnify:CR=1 FL=1
MKTRVTGPWEGRRRTPTVAALALLLVLSCAVGLGITAHGSPAPERIAPAPGAPAATMVQGHITEDTTWTPAGNPYIVTGPSWGGHLVVDGGVTLTIEPGVVVKFEAYHRDLTVEGRLRAQGTAAAPIVFTSYKDDFHGGDSNGDDTATQPAPGDWSNSAFAKSSANNRLQHVWVSHGCGDFQYETVATYTDEDALTLNHITITQSAHHGLQIFGDWPAIDHSEFSHNLYGINVHNADPLTSSIHLKNSRFISNTHWAVQFDTFSEAIGTDIDADTNEATGNGGNGWYLGDGKHMTGTVTMTATEDFPLVFGPGSLIEPDATLTLAPGTTVKFATEGSGLNVQP